MHQFSDVNSNEDSFSIDNESLADTSPLTGPGDCNSKRAVLELFLALVWIRSKEAQVLVNDNITGIF